MTLAPDESATKALTSRLEIRGRRAADRGERGLAERAADDDGVGGVVELLEQRAEHDRQREEQHPLPDAALRDGIAGGDFIFHKRSRLLIP